MSNTNHADAFATASFLEIVRTTDNSLIHKAYQALSAGVRNTLLAKIIICFSGTIATLLPLLLIASFDLASLTQPSPGTEGAKGLALLYDFNVLCMFTISLPLMIFFIITDDELLINALKKIIGDEILEIKLDEARNLITAWGDNFALLNRYAQIFGVAVGLCVGYFNYDAFSQPGVGYWAMKPDGFSITGWVYIYCIFVFYWVLPVFVLRSIGISLFLKAVVRHSNIKLVPFHPDRCGGLRPVGNLGLRNQYMLAVLGVNLVILWLIYPAALHLNPTIIWLLRAAAIAYFILGPLVFVLPLLPFRNAMQHTKDELMHTVAKRIRSELKRIRDLLENNNEITKADEELIDRLQKVNTVVDKFPVWPFDTQTKRKFATAYTAPILTKVVTLAWPSSEKIPHLNEMIKLLTN